MSAAKLFGRMFGRALSLPRVVAKVTVVERVTMPMRDGTRLVASVYAPSDCGGLPAGEAHLVEATTVDGEAEAEEEGGNATLAALRSFFSPRPRGASGSTPSGSTPAAAPEAVRVSAARGKAPLSPASPSLSAADGAAASPPASPVASAAKGKALLAGAYPTILVRTPYNRKHFDFFAVRFAERGYVVVLQDTRGRCDSPGDSDPLLFDEMDGQDTLRWIRAQPFYLAFPKVALWGMSFLGIVQYASLPRQGEEDDFPPPDAMMPIMCSSELYSVMRPDQGVALSLFARWHYITHRITAETNLMQLAKLFGIDLDRKVNDMVFDSPLSELDFRLTGSPQLTKMGYHLMNHCMLPDSAEFWTTRNYSDKLTHCKTPTHLVGGWHDFFLRQVLRDYETMAEHQDTTDLYLTIGPWAHFDMGAVLMGLQEGLWWFEQKLKGKPLPPDYDRRLPVRLFIQGLEDWREFPAWPPPAVHAPLYLRQGFHLSSSFPTSAQEDPASYTYDPADPTPSLGGPDFHPSNAGPKSQNKIEARADVLSYTSQPLNIDLELIGKVRCELHVHSDADTTDFVARLCVVTDSLTGSKSRNICEGSIRLETPPARRSAIRKVAIDMWATAYKLNAGERLRLQVCSGAHPRLMRNTGLSDIRVHEPLLKAEQTVFHDDSHPSYLVLPVVKGMLPT